MKKQDERRNRKENKINGNMIKLRFADRKRKKEIFTLHIESKRF